MNNSKLTIRISILPFVFLCLQFSTSYSQVGFEEHVVLSNYGITYNLNDIFISDLDSDGLDDIVFSSKNDRQIAWFKNLDGLGNYGTMRIITSTFNSHERVISMDVDNDNDMDIVATQGYILPVNFHTTRLVWFENLDGQGSFSNPKLVHEPVTAFYLSSFDFNGDGVENIVTSYNSFSDSDSGYLVYEGNDSFSYHSLSSLINHEGGLAYRASGDIDSDGDDDFLISNGSYFRVFRNAPGNGVFEDPDTIFTDERLEEIQLGDMDSDGDLDVVFSAGGGTGIANMVWTENIDGLGNFNDFNIIDSSNQSFRFVNIADMNQDNQLDIVCGSTKHDQVVWFENLGNGAFGESQLITDQIGTVKEVQVFDYDGDGVVEVLVGTWNNIYVVENDNQEFAIVKSFSKPRLNLNNLFSSDLDGDGDKDLISCYESTAELVWQENINGSNAFGTPMVIEGNSYAITLLTTFDADMDGDQDIIFVEEDPENLTWNPVFMLKNLDNGNTWSEPELIFEELRYDNKIIGADLDMDLDIDLIITDYSSILWFENLDGLGDFGEAQEALKGSRFNDVLALDYNNDSSIDIVALSDGGAVYFAPNIDSLGTFGDRVIESTGHSNIVSISSGDLGNDGDIDILASGDGHNIILENIDSLGTYEEMLEIFDLRTYNAEFVDLDVDGDLDIFMDGSSKDSLFWYENINGLDQFERRVLPFYLAWPQDIIIDDLNFDGLPDILTYSWNDKIIWLENTGLNVNRIIGKVFLDDNADNCLTSGVQIPDLLISTMGTNQSLSTLSHSDKYFSLDVREGMYKTEISTILNNNYAINPESFIHDFMDIGNVDTTLFCLEILAEVEDLNISIIPQDELRPGFSSNYRIVISNQGTQVRSGEIMFQFDEEALSFINASPLASSETSSSLTFEYQDLKTFESKHFDVRFKAALIPQIMLDQVITFEASIDVNQNELSPEDNRFTLEQTVIGSFDPNDITVLEGDEVHIDNVGNFLHYVVRFQNTGTAPAIHVRVANTLDEKLDWRTLDVLSTSHPQMLTMVDSTQMEFYFENIYLPDSTSSLEESNGFISYRVKPYPNTVLGDIVYNSAEIYFDFNPPIFTNVVSTTYVDVSSSQDLTLDKTQLFPNPATSEIFVRSELPIQKIEIYELNGLMLNSFAPAGSINLEALKSGVYICRIKTADKVISKMFIKI